MEMSDRELLEFAAKAAGCEVVWCSWYGRFTGDVSGFRFGDSLGQVWNPLEDDGDALRLAVKLKLDIAIDDYVQVSWWREQGLLDWVNENCCRRAIVRAAAEIGKAMQEQPK